MTDSKSDNEAKTDAKGNTPIVRVHGEELTAEKGKQIDKAIDNGAAVFFYPEHNLGIVADDQDAANEALEKHLKAGDK